MNDFQPQIIAFCCSNCASAAADTANRLGMTLPDNIRVIQVPCTGRIEILHLLKPFEEGADGVYVAGCQEDSCQFVKGVSKAAKRVAETKNILSTLNLEPDRIGLFNLSAGKGQRFIEVAHEMTEKVKQLGPAMKAGS